MGALTKIFGTHSEREIKRINPIVEKVEALRDTMMALSDEELKNRTKEYKERFAGGATLDELLPEAYQQWRSRWAMLFSVVGFALGVLLIFSHAH